MNNFSFSKHRAAGVLAVVMAIGALASIGFLIYRKKYMDRVIRLAHTDMSGILHVKR